MPLSPMTESEQQRLVESLLDEITEGQRLDALSDFDLIREVLKDDIADDRRVLAMMRRIYPKWTEEPDAPAKLERPISVCVALPIDVAHDVVAFSECHCGEAVATGEDVEVPENKPCLYCACRSALARSTGLEMYKGDDV